MQIHFMHAQMHVGGLHAIFALSRTLKFESEVIKNFDRCFDPPLFASKMIVGRETMTSVKSEYRASFPVYADVLVMLSSGLYDCGDTGTDILRTMVHSKVGFKAYVLVSIGRHLECSLPSVTVLNNPHVHDLIHAIEHSYTGF